MVFRRATSPETGQEVVPVTRLVIPSAEWLDVYRRVASFVHPDERTPLGHVLLRVGGGQRRWWAVDPWRITVLDGGADAAVLEVALPPRLVEAAVVLAGAGGEDGGGGEDTVLEVTAGDEGTATALTLRAGASSVTVGAGPAGQPDVAEITTRRLESESVRVRVDRAALADLVGLGRRAPLGSDPEEGTGPWPLFWMEVEAGTLSLSVDWPEFGKWSLSMPCRADGECRVPVGPLFLHEYLECLDDDEVGLLLPADRRTYLLVQAEGWSGYVLPVDRTAEAHRSRLEEQMQHIGLGPLVRDHDGDYAFRFGTSDLYVRLVENDPPRVRIFSVVLEDVEETPDLLRELNSINASPYFARAFLVGKQVMVGWELIAETLDDEELRLTCAEVVRLASGTGPFLARIFGGRTAYADGDEGDSPPGPGTDEVRLP